MLGVEELRVGVAASEAPPFETVVDEAEDGDDEGAKIKEKTSFSLRSVWSLPSVRSLLFGSSPQRNLHTGLVSTCFNTITDFPDYGYSQVVTERRGRERRSQYGRKAA